MLILQLAIILIASKIAGDISVRFRQPSVLGKLLVGILLGPAVFNWIHATEIIMEISQIGVILLMLIAGLETDLNQFRKTGKASVYVGFLGIITPLAFGYFMGMIIGVSGAEALFIGLLLSATSVSISVQALRELKLMNSKAGTTILGAAVIDDVVVIFMLAFLLSIIGGDIHLASVTFQIGSFFIIGTIALLFGIPWLMKRFAFLRVTEAIVSGALIVCFLLASFAEYAGVAGIIGAYMAGIGLSLTRFKQEVVRKVETISFTVFVPVFFTSIGLAVEFTGLEDYIVLIIVFSLLAIFSKLIGGALGARAAGFSWWQSAGIGSAMVSRGEVALIIAGIGLNSGLVQREMFTVMIIVVLITTIVTPPMMKWCFSRTEIH